MVYTGFPRAGTGPKIQVVIGRVLRGISPGLGRVAFRIIPRDLGLSCS
jgi:hypothetical protein